MIKDHDSEAEAKASKTSPTRRAVPKAKPAQSTGPQPKSLNRSTRKGNDERPWCRPDNPEIWEGDEDDDG